MALEKGNCKVKAETSLKDELYVTSLAEMKVIQRLKLYSGFTDKVALAVRDDDPELKEILYIARNLGIKFRETVPNANVVKESPGCVMNKRRSGDVKEKYMGGNGKHGRGKGKC